MPQTSRPLLDEVRDGLRSLDEKLDRVASTLERNTISLEYHVKRTNELEAYVHTVDDRVKPLEVSRERMFGALKLFSVISTVAAGIFALVKLLHL